MTSTAEIVAASAAKAAGLSLTDAGKENIVALIETGASFKPGSEVEITLDGQTVPVTQWLAGLAKSSPSWFRSNAGSKPKTTPSGETMTARGIRLNAAVNRQERLRTEAAELAERNGNPYTTGNLSHRMFVEKNAPDLAAKLRAHAGVRK